MASEPYLCLRADAMHNDEDLGALARQTEGRDPRAKHSLVRHCSVDPIRCGSPDVVRLDQFALPSVIA